MLACRYFVLLMAALAYTGCISASTHEIEEVNPSTSSGTHEIEEVSPRWKPPVPAGPLVTIPQRPTVDEYIKKLSPERIERLHSGLPEHADANPYHSIPFYGRLPIFDLKAPSNVVEQALKDYRSVLVIDDATKQVSQVNYQAFRISKVPFDDDKGALFLHSLDLNVHTLHRKYFPVGVGPIAEPKMPGRVEIDHLPHVGTIPVLTYGHDSLGHMFSAANTGLFRFWHVREGHDPVLVMPRTALIARAGTRTEDLQVNTVLTLYGALTQQYNPVIASLRYGRPIPLDERDIYSRSKPVPLLQYPRFDTRATREQMIQALQQRGRFRYYDNNAASDGPIKVKVLNHRAPPGVPMDIAIEKLSGNEIAQEGFLKKLRAVRLRMLV
ncbi:hypothetical protein PHBOTO_004007 [Pseudozyma hubeiensis]|nr:hypothetical protein PHBOTO_004007 [Pseudozyma hubeiensis]